jgi:hypothetical protein
LKTKSYTSLTSYSDGSYSAGTYSDSLFRKAFNLPLAGIRNTSIMSQGVFGQYWSSSPKASRARYFTFG